MIKIRIADSSDAEQITAVINAAFRIAEEFFIDGNRISLAEVRQHLSTGVFLVAENDEAIAGCVYLEPRGERAYLGLLSVDPARQQGGLGSRLMTAGEEYCRAGGARFMDIYIVNLRTDLPAYYGNRGYVENGTTPFPADVPTKVPCHFINMSKPL
ncbi:MAG TPA: GNAT family N-acetyltransferase [Pyrinomonadaceae bacterium]|nr:GNAT family N-acetyltransferase [Pyrinomonadaceae bacterium]